MDLDETIKPEIIPYTTPEELKPHQVPDIEGIKLNIGSGNTNIEGMVNIDKFSSVADVNKDIFELDYKPGSIANIRCFALLEHLSFREARILLSKFHIWLKPEGVLQLIVPDMDWMCGRWLGKPEERPLLLAYFYGDQSSNGQFHKCGFNSDILCLLLKESKLDNGALFSIKAYGQVVLYAVAQKEVT